MIRLTYNNVMKEVAQPHDYDELLENLGSQFGVSHTAEQKFFFLDEDGDVLTVSSTQEFMDNVEFMQVSGERIPSLIYANLNDISQVRDQLKGRKVAGANDEPLKPEITAYIDATIKREVAAYCAANLPLMIAEQIKQQLEKSMPQAVANQGLVIPEEEEEEEVVVVKEQVKVDDHGVRQSWQAGDGMFANQLSAKAHEAASASQPRESWMDPSFSSEHEEEKKQGAGAQVSWRDNLKPVAAIPEDADDSMGDHIPKQINNAASSEENFGNIVVANPAQPAAQPAANEKLREAAQFHDADPRQQYIDQLDDSLDQKLRKQMLELFDLGLSEYKANLNAIKKYRDVNAAADHLYTHGSSGLYE